MFDEVDVDQEVDMDDETEMDDEVDPVYTGIEPAGSPARSEWFKPDTGSVYQHLLTACNERNGTGWDPCQHYHCPGLS